MALERCKICLESVQGKSFAKLTSNFFSPVKTVKEMIITCVPSMENIVADNDLLCENCLAALNIAHSFITRCLSSFETFAKSNTKEIILMETELYDNSDFVLLNEENIEYEEIVEDTSSIVVELNVPASQENDSVIACNSEEQNIENCELNSLKDGNVDLDLVVEKASALFDLDDELKNENNRIFVRTDSTRNGNICDHSIQEESLKQNLTIDTNPNNNNMYRKSTNSELENIIKENDTKANGDSSMVNDNSIEVIELEFLNEEETNTDQNSVSVSDNSVNESEIFKCSKCDESFDSHSKWKVHQKSFHQVTRGRLKCEVCDEAFSTPKILVSHKATVHSDYRPHICQICNKGFKNLYILERHMTKDCSMYCKECDIKFDKLEIFNEHNKSHANFLCEICGKVFLKEFQVKNHMVVHKGKTHMCELCGNMYLNNSNLLVHLRRHHNNESKHSCDQCSQLFASDSDLKDHMLKHVGPKLFGCEHCGKYYKSKQLLVLHVETIHMNLKRFKCHICGRNFPKKHTMDNHIRRHLSGGRTRRENGVEVRIACDICGKLYKFQSQLDVHRKSHDEGNPYKCPICNLAFGSMTSVYKHKKIQHDPDKKFRCEMCNKRFDTEPELSNHALYHKNRPKRYRCDICGDRFGRRFLYENHIRYTHYDEDNQEIVGKDVMMTSAANDQQLNGMKQKD